MSTHELSFSFKQVDNPLEADGMIATGDHKLAAQLLNHGWSGFFPWGTMYAWGCLPTHESVSLMADNKGRDPQKKPFFLSSTNHYIDNLLKKSELIENTPAPVVDVVKKFYQLGEKTGHPAALLLPATEHDNLPEGLTGHTVIPDHNGLPQTFKTTGMMVAGSAALHYRQILSHLDDHVITVTSANFSGLGGGSGHHRAGGLVKDFNHLKKVFIFIGDPHQEGQGISTSVACITYNQANFITAYLTRDGSLSIQEMTNMLLLSGISRVVIDSNIKRVPPYDYSSYLPTELGEIFDQLINNISVHQTLQISVR